MSAGPLVLRAGTGATGATAGGTAGPDRTPHPDGRAGDGVVQAITPESAGWSYSGLTVLALAPGGRHRVGGGADEALVLPLAGAVRVEVDGVTVDLLGRRDVFAGPTDAVFLGRGSRATLVAPDDAPARVAVATARATRTLPSRRLAARDARVELRGAGAMSRRVTNYTLGTDVDVDRLLVCEVLTPGGNWSSYPPHKHDVHAEDERPLEEIYYFEVAAAPAEVGAAPGVGYHRVYASGKPVDVLAEVRTGDAVLVPHGYHGPSMAAPGYDLYYLNVMAGPADDVRWLATDDPAHAWVRATWEGQPVDPRLLPDGAAPRSAGAAPARPAGPSTARTPEEAP
ncbi:5-deoxy-glucuronate isomerase [Georgenia faecalis]|uniref:5-deoxy-glucuronate isomerase n=1 Tax=Georgenia faecalis TaxID=2483799 RepID=UPI001F49838A|nr:5-deoxy-glucuronate isomerase [Georgenia faecalis]